MDVRCKLAPAVGVAQEVAYDGEDGADHLDRDVEPGADDLKKARRQLRGSGLDRKKGKVTHPKDHAGRKDDPEGEDLNNDVYP